MIRFLFIIATCFLSMGIGWWSWQTWGRPIKELSKLEELVPVPDAEQNEVLRRDLERWRVEFEKEWSMAKTEEQKREVIGDARILLELVIPEMLKCWIGTPYDFNGTAEKPGGGRLACGYYVSTVLRDAGFQVDRYQLAQQASENIIRSFIPGKQCDLKVGMDFISYRQWLESIADGIYIVGLDSHVGFLVKNEDGLVFYHSSGWRERGVVSEKVNEAGALERSTWRMLGGLTQSPDTIQKWIMGKTFVVKK